VSAQSYHALI